MLRYKVDLLIDVQVISKEANFVTVRLNSNADSGSATLVRTDLLCSVRALLKKIKQTVLVGDNVQVDSIDWTDKRGRTCHTPHAFCQAFVGVYRNRAALQQSCTVCLTLPLTTLFADSYKRTHSSLGTEVPVQAQPSACPVLLHTFESHRHPGNAHALHALLKQVWFKRCSVGTAR